MFHKYANILYIVCLVNEYYVDSIKEVVTRVFIFHEEFKVLEDLSERETKSL